MRTQVSRFLLVSGIATLLAGSGVLAQTARGTVTRAAPSPSKAVTPSLQSAASEGLKNADVIKMAAAKLADDIIIKAIEDAPKKAFDLSPTGLVALKTGGVSNEVIRVMKGLPALVDSSRNSNPTPAAVASESPQSQTIPPPTAVKQAEATATPVQPEKKRGFFGTIGGTVARVKDIRIGDGSDKDKNETKENKESMTKQQPAANVADDTIATPKRNEPAVFTTSLDRNAACTMVRDYFVTNDIELEATDCAVGQLKTVPVQKTGWIVDKAKRTVVNFVQANGGTEVRVRVMQKGSGFFSVNGGKQADEKTEGVDAKGSAKMATQLRQLLVSRPPRDTPR
jgi:hypothetical protein